MMWMSFNLLLPMLLLVLGFGIFLLLKTHKLGWKVLGWILVAIVGLLLVLMSGVFSRAYRG